MLEQLGGPARTRTCAEWKMAPTQPSSAPAPGAERLRLARGCKQGQAQEGCICCGAGAGGWSERRPPGRAGLLSFWFLGRPGR